MIMPGHCLCMMLRFPNDFWSTIKTAILARVAISCQNSYRLVITCLDTFRQQQLVLSCQVLQSYIHIPYPMT
ncbi:Ribonuclease Trv [Fusarium oxysporum f. sp. albedinis]|nr:Ribonuclease Trv [Fusarium oxysporum f. sp. albedinis]